MFSILFLISLFDISWCEQLYLSVVENTKPSNPIGNLQLMVKNQTNSWNNLEFKQFNQIIGNDDNFAAKSLIKIDKNNGNILLQSSIDRENICQLMKECKGITSLDYLITVDKSIFKLKIEIIDVNDNSPSFSPDSKQIEIPEGTPKWTNISLPVAKDQDSERFAAKDYVLKAISNNNDYEKYFKLFIHPSTKNPFLTVIGDLDRELTESFEFNLFAIDGGNNQGKCKILVKINDINDNTPQWIGLPYRTKIRECTTENKAKILMADDRDDKSSPSGKITYKISDNTGNNDVISGVFFISEETLYFNSGSLRSLGQSNISVPVLAIDGGGRSNETTVDIEILDCNDHAPMITIENRMPTVSENYNNVTSLSRITVTDNDYGVNSQFDCNLNDTSHVTLTQPYIMNSESKKNLIKIFDLQTVFDMGFDREITPRHSIEIVCTDNGQPRMSSSGIITIFISDQNDNRPKFDLKSNSFSISEDARIGSEVGRVVATDSDISPNNVITYSIVGDEESRSTFSVTNQGQIQLFRAIDRERIDRYKFKVIAIDNGDPSLNDSCEIQILVLDVNDCKPVIKKEHHFKIVESHGRETLHMNFGKLNATDQDYGPNGSLTFQLASIYPNSSPLRVLSDGRISIYGIIDREKRDRIEEEVIVFDGGPFRHTSTTTIIVDILDVNDNIPKFIYSSGKFNTFINVSLDLSPGSIIHHLNATDPDNGNNGTIDFSLIGTEEQKKRFSVHPDGQITLNEKLVSTRNHDQLKVEVKDRGTPPLNQITTLFIRYLASKTDNLKINKKGPTLGKKENNYESNIFKNGSSSWSNVMMLIYLLAAVVFIIIVGIGGTFLYLWCRGQWFCQMGDSDKQTSSRESRSSNNAKTVTKSDKSQTMVSNMEINNQLLRTRNNSYQTVESPQLVSYASLVKNFNGIPIDQTYQFRTMIVGGNGGGGGNYSAFHPRSLTPLNDNDNGDFSPFTNDDMWDHTFSQNHPNTIDTARNRNLSDESENVYDNHKYSVATAANFDNNGHFMTPCQSRRSADIIQSKNDLTYKPKVNYVASSFV